MTEIAQAINKTIDAARELQALETALRDAVAPDDVQAGPDRRGLPTQQRSLRCTRAVAKGDRK